ncbi:NapD family periplasmic nitrate reductase component [Leminorella grimontii ATCC 33999 = DSM 5078]|nr:NapD family periplasmic nitrate reductase component [Leminorella grimontii ATCC 33999 = DSM 5078]
MQAEDADALYAQIESARDIAGVLAVSLVYHQQDEQGEDTP